MPAKIQSSTQVAFGQVRRFIFELPRCFDGSSYDIRLTIPSQYRHVHLWSSFQAFDCDVCHQCAMPYRTRPQCWLSPARISPSSSLCKDRRYVWIEFLTLRTSPLPTHHLSARTRTYSITICSSNCSYFYCVLLPAFLAPSLFFSALLSDRLGVTLGPLSEAYHNDDLRRIVDHVWRDSLNARASLKKMS